MGVDGGLVRGGQNIGAFEHLQIVVERDGAEGHGQRHQREGNRASGDAQNSGKEVEFGPEADQGRDSG